MRLCLLDWLRDPITGDRLEAHPFEQRQDPADGALDIIEGVLISARARHVYAIMGGVPVMLPDGLPAEFCARHRTRLDDLAHASALLYKIATDAGFSFSQEWETHWEQQVARTWGWTLSERVEQFFLETESTPDELARRLLLDAGCGSGQLTHAIADQGPNVIGLDLSTGVFLAEKHRTSSRVHYVHGNLLCAPFAPGAFDLIYSLGVLHHTPNTFEAFYKVSQLVHPEGKFYLWLYHWPRTLVQGWIKRPIVEAMRGIICRLPLALQRVCVQLYARMLHARNVLFRRQGVPTLAELLVEVYDTLTPRYRHHHTPYEVAEWFYRLGFGAPRLTHWDNPLGFGMMAKREPLVATPGVSYTATKERRAA